jgi:hypothetical protein
MTDRSWVLLVIVTVCLLLGELVYTLVVASGATDPAEDITSRRPPAASSPARSHAAATPPIETTTTTPATTTSTSMPRSHETAPMRTAGDVWDALAQCESSGRWDLADGLHEGGLQFAPETWDSFRDSTDAEAAYLATPDRQIAVAKRVLRDQGVRAWPSCGPRVGLTMAAAA